MDIKENIKRVIKMHGWTSVRVAEARGVTKVTFAQTIARNPTVNTLQEIADIIGADISEFFTTPQNRGEEKAQNTIICPCCGSKLQITEIKTPTI